jgi:hypothetical protein
MTENANINLIQPSSWKSMLSVKPVKNAAAEFIPLDTDKLQISVKKQKPEFLKPPVSWFIRPKLKQTIVIDQVGIQVLNLCDGNRTIENIVDEFAKTHKLTFHESRVSVTGYIKQLVQRGILVIIK